MASITSLSNSSYNTSSIYGNRNVLSGLASGMDTESMIENAVSGIKLKIQNLQKKRTKVEWQQEAYRSIIDKAVNFNNKYTSFSSKTNLLSNSFFTNAVNTTTAGTFKDKITASGKTSSDVKIYGVKQMAKAATYTVSGLATQMGGNAGAINGREDFDIKGNMTVSTVSGRLSFQYGGTNGTSFDISFDELEDLTEFEGKNNAEKLANAINKKLSEVTYTYTKNGFKETTTADKAIKVQVSNGQITFTDGLGEGNKVSLGASGNIKSAFGLSSMDNQEIKVGDTALTKQMPTQGYLADKTLGVTFNGTTKQISMSDVLEKAGILGTDDATTGNMKFRVALQEQLDDAFGKGKISVSNQDGKLSFAASGEGSTLSLGGSAIEALGFENGDSNFINSGKTLSDLLGEDNELFANNRLRGTFSTYDAAPIEKKNGNGETYYVDHKGNRVDKDGYRITDTGKNIYDFQVNGTSISVTGDTTLESLMNSINSNAEAGVKVSYSKLTNEFQFTTTDTGANSKIEFGGLAQGLFGTPNTPEYDTSKKASELLGEDYDYGSEFANFTMNVKGTDFSVHADENSTMDSIVDQLNDMLSVVGELDKPEYKGVQASFDKESNSIVFRDADGNVVESSAGNGVAKDLLGKVSEEYPPATGSFTAGQDAIMDVEINGKRFENLTRDSNSFDIDGLTINVKGTFNEDGAKVDSEGKEIEPVTFTSTTDSDKIIEAIRSFVEDYNEMATEIKNAYSTLPAEKSNGNRYEPLTAEQEDQYSESELAAYNEKAKQGILFGDTNLSSMYSKLLSAITPGGTDGQILREIGITTAYNDGMTTLSLDEDKLRNALDSDPDKVRNAFAKTKEGGSSSDGLMQTMQNTLNSYVKTTGEPKGILITRAGSVKAPTSLNNNSLKSQIDNIDKQIERWQDKIEDQIDRYTTKFSKLEQLIAEMNSQSSAMMGLLSGGSSGY